MTPDETIAQLNEAVAKLRANEGIYIAAHPNQLGVAPIVSIGGNLHAITLAQELSTEGFNPGVKFSGPFRENDESELTQLRADLAREKERADRAERLGVEMVDHAELIWNTLQEISPWTESNDMDWIDEIMCGLAGAKNRAQSAESRLATLQGIANVMEKALMASEGMLMMCRDHFAEGDGMTDWAKQCMLDMKKVREAKEAYRAFTAEGQKKP